MVVALQVLTGPSVAYAVTTPLPLAMERLALKRRVERLCVRFRLSGKRPLLKRKGAGSRGLPRSVGPATLGS